MDIRLVPMTRAYMQELFRKFEYDPDIFLDLSLYEKAKQGGYSFQTVDALFDRHSGQKDRLSFAVLQGENVIGQVDLKHIDPVAKTCELSIHLQSDGVKNKGYGTRAEQLAIAYAFETLGMDRILADTVTKNTRSQHVLEKLGFRCINEANGFRTYQLNR